MDRWTPLPLLALLAVAAAAGPAAAQLETCGPLSLDVDPGTVNVTPGETVTVTLLASNEGQFDGTAALQASASEGWDVRLDRASVPVNASDQEEVELFVKASQDAADYGAPYFVDVEGTLDCGLGDPAQASTTLEPTLNTTADDTAAPDGGVGPDLSIVGLGFLAAVALLTALAVVPVVRARRALHVEARDEVLAVVAGHGASFAVEVVNRHDEPDVLDLEVGDVPAGWSAFVAVPKLELEAGEERTIWVLVRAPHDAEPGDHVGIPLRVTSRELDRHAEVVLRANVLREDPDEDA